MTARSTLPCSFTLLGTGFEGTSPTLLLTTHKRPRYGAFSSADAPPVESLFFNCGECACRIAGEARLKLGRTTAVALTRAAPGHVAGLPSLIFHLADGGGCPVLRVFGGGGAGSAYVRAVGAFVSRRFPEVTHGGADDSGDGGAPPLLLHDSRAGPRYAGWGAAPAGARARPRKPRLRWWWTLLRAVRG